MQSDLSGVMNGISEIDDAHGVVALSQWISNDAHLFEARDADVWRNAHVAALESVLPYINLGKKSGRTPSSAINMSTSETSTFSASDHNAPGPEGMGQRTRGTGQRQTCFNGNIVYSTDHLLGVHPLFKSGSAPKPSSSLVSFKIQYISPSLGFEIGLWDSLP